MHLFRWIAGLLFLWPIVVCAHLTIAPPQILLSRKGVALTEVRSTAHTLTHWQVRVMRWTQIDNQDVLEAAPEIEIAPRFFHLNDGEAQVIRALIPVSNTHYFRILIEQIRDDANEQGIALNFRFSLPVYRSTNEPVPRIIDIPPTESCLNVVNSTNKVQQLNARTAITGLHHVLPNATILVCRKEPRNL